jgi:predicted DNA-binding transcriptional regulator YafY
MLASRLLSILMLLQTRGRMSATDLAAQFEVSVRTVYRDIDQLSAAGVPVFADRGRSGGFQLLDGYRTKLTGLTQSEAEALFLAGLPGPAAELGLAEILATAQLKLLAALPGHVQPQADRIGASFHLDPTAWFRGADANPSLQIVARAVWSGHYLDVRYRRAGQAETRAHRLGPLGLVLKGGIWYLVAQSGKSIRTFRAANIRENPRGIMKRASIASMPTSASRKQVLRGWTCWDPMSWRQRPGRLADRIGGGGSAAPCRSSRPSTVSGS